MTGRLEGKRAFVTGASQGIGRATALAFAQEGATVYAASRRPEDVEWRTGHGVTPVRLDVTDASDVARVLSDAEPLDILVNCVGWVHSGTVLTTSDEDWATTLATNVTSMFHTIRAVLPGMLQRGAGSIVNVSSVVSSAAGVANRFAYGTSKAAVIGLTKSIAADYVATGVRCNAVLPGTTESPSLDARIAASGDVESARAAFIARQPMGRLGRADEIAAAILWLASDESAFATGTTVVVDGGLTL